MAAGVADRVTTMRADMAALPFEPGSFDLIWCEGAVFIMGVSRALEAWRGLLRPGGYLVCSDPLAERIPGALEKYSGDEASLATIGQAVDEMTMRRTYPDAYGYEFIVARLT